MPHRRRLDLFIAGSSARTREAISCLFARTHRHSPSPPYKAIMSFEMRFRRVLNSRWRVIIASKFAQTVSLRRSRDVPGIRAYSHYEMKISQQTICPCAFCRYEIHCSPLCLLKNREKIEFDWLDQEQPDRL
jgi:hypothetical protein